jgi:NTP pyrophosphatase (non-canonical NTP hydrolase)
MNLKEYQDFVESVTSECSNNIDALSERMDVLARDAIFEDQNTNIALLLTATIGMVSEGGELQEIVKKLLFQGKPLTAETTNHMKRELGDVIFYWVNACRAIGVTPNEVIEGNFEKLSTRYPDGFSVERSENRNKNDI